MKYSVPHWTPVILARKLVPSRVNFYKSKKLIKMKASLFMMGIATSTSKVVGTFLQRAMAVHERNNMMDTMTPLNKTLHHYHHQAIHHHHHEQPTHHHQQSHHEPTHQPRHEPTHHHHQHTMPTRHHLDHHAPLDVSPAFFSVGETQKLNFLVHLLNHTLDSTKSAHYMKKLKKIIVQPLGKIIHNCKDDMATLCSLDIATEMKLDFSVRMQDVMANIACLDERLLEASQQCQSAVETLVFKKPRHHHRHHYAPMKPQVA